MFCPTCGQEQVSDVTRFCSRCGFLMSGIAEVVANGGAIPGSTQTVPLQKDSPRRRGIKQGLMLFLVGCFLVLPLVIILTVNLRLGPSLAIITGILSFCGGLLRMLYAAMFEEGIAQMLPSAPANFAGLYVANPAQNQQLGALPQHQSIPADAYVNPGSWRETNDLVEPGSVVDSTTKLFEKEK